MPFVFWLCFSEGVISSCIKLDQEGYMLIGFVFVSCVLQINLLSFYVYWCVSQCNNQSVNSVKRCISKIRYSIFKNQKNRTK